MSSSFQHIKHTSDVKGFLILCITESKILSCKLLEEKGEGKGGRGKGLTLRIGPNALWYLVTPLFLLEGTFCISSLNIAISPPAVSLFSAKESQSTENCKCFNFWFRKGGQFTTSHSICPGRIQPFSSVCLWNSILCSHIPCRDKYFYMNRNLFGVWCIYDCSYPHACMFGQMHILMLLLFVKMWK